MEYPNLYKRQKIVALEFPKMRLEDGFEWHIVKDASLSSKEVLEVGDDVDIEPMGATRPGEEIKSYKVIKDPKKQGFKALWLNSPDKGIKKSIDYNIEKKRKGIISDSSVSESESDKDNPDEWLNQNLKIKEVLGDDHIVVMNVSGKASEWAWALLTKNNFKGWVEGQPARIFKSELKPTKYWMENLAMPNIQAVAVSFVGLAKSKF